ncbi:serine carboxypeptidase [Piedraia hortae CBS 480.64]|uniref:Carboxypeptidase n=1 Tax=Piedraia hortae CBS 480.64 TaxID=1314780 RepID=A0A6A7BRZ0_9PEZI|nr:serine carboxypeptidase [Piedraia hortae CBS 480.64]
MPHNLHRPYWVAVLVLALAWMPFSLAEKSAADYYVPKLPGAPADEPLRRMYAGHLEITPEHHGNMFFWFLRNRHISDRRRTVIWLNGGPGCSSLDGAMMEIGPYRVQKDGNLHVVEGSWDEFANVLFVDNPVGVGFSYVDGDSYLHELDDMAAQFITFLEKWFAVFPEHSKDDLYLAGESYAGQYIPYIAKALLDRNDRTGSDQQWNLTGLLIGNGWISAPEQYRAYLQFAYQEGLVERGSPEDASALDQQAKCMTDLENGGKDHVDMTSCDAILRDILRTTQTEKQCFNMYDVRLRDSYPQCGMNWPPDLEYVTPYLRRQDVLDALHVNKDKHGGWTECNGQVGQQFTARNSQPSSKLFPNLLERVRILLFSGDKDLICNHIGTENFIAGMTWNGAKGMELSPGVTAPRRDWEFEGQPAGQYQTARNLTYLRFYNASHMVPFDHPRRARDMLDRFMGVDIGSIGGQPANSLIDGEKAHPVTSVGSHPNSTAAQEEADQKVKDAKWHAYKRSGELALFVVIIAAAAWGIFVYRSRSKRAGYSSLNLFPRGGAGDPYDGGQEWGLDEIRRDKSRENEQRDVEAAREFDETSLDDLTEDHEESPARKN